MSELRSSLAPLRNQDWTKSHGWDRKSKQTITTYPQGYMNVLIHAGTKRVSDEKGDSTNNEIAINETAKKDKTHRNQTKLKGPKKTTVY